jgi:protein-tyrosine phosphatase
VPTVLFLCTGNYYRSRFAECLFNALAEREGLDWRATSRGLALERGVTNVGPLSHYAREALARHSLTADERMPLAVQAGDLSGADLIIALDENEHLPLVLERHHDAADRVTFWNVPDVGDMAPAEALSEVERLVEALIRSKSA